MPHVFGIETALGRAVTVGVGTGVGTGTAVVAGNGSDSGGRYIVSLGIDLQGIATLRSLQSGIAFAMKTEREGSSTG